MFAKGFYADKTGLIFKKGLRLNDILYRHVPKTNGFTISVVDKKSERYWCKLLVNDLKGMDGNDFGHDACVQYDLILCVASSIKSRKGVPYETVVAETLSAYVQNLSPSGVVILYVESNGEISASQSAIVFEELNKRLAKNEINATYYSERHYVLGETQHGMYVCVEPYSIRAILNRVAIYSGADERFFHNSLMYWNPIAKKFEEDGTEINVHVKRRDSDVAQFEEAYRSMLEYYARLIDPTNGFLSGSISYYLEQLGYDVLVIKRNDIKDETINRIRQELLDFESNENHEDYTQPIVGVEDNSLSARYSEITSKTEGYGNSRESLSLQLERTCVALMVLLERIGAYLHGIYVAEMDMGTINKSKLLYMYFDVSRIEESSSHICFNESGFSRVTNYLMGLFLHRSQDKLIYYIQKSQVASVKAAIGSIMSRNGSHNIGSHVLAALSHNVGTMPDDRVLYQYIQQRMDYIATATTEFPTWRQPTLFVNEVLKTFLSQKHLLNYIAGSEGLSAYQFQNPTIGCDSEQPNTIRIHARRLKRLECIEKFKSSETNQEGVYYAGKDVIETSFILYPSDDGFQSDGMWNAHLEKDIELAIPNGEVGQHALFTIIENVIRNAAKHAWVKLSGEGNEHLDVYLDFKDNPKKGVVEFLVWAEGEISRELYNQLVDKMGLKFISEEGKLHKENWGFAEMRISAGYLKGAKIRTIGGLDGSEACLDLICPVLVIPDGDTQSANSSLVCENKEHLGFRFDVYKPRELLILTESQLKDYNTQRNLLRQYGVWIMSKAEAAKESALPFSYVLLENFDGNKDANALKLPFRIICEGNVENVTNPKANLFPRMSKKDRIIANIKKYLDGVSNDSDAKCLAKGFLENVYCCWVLHLKNIARQCGLDVPEDEPLPIVIDVAEDSSPEGSGKGLVDTPDIMRFVLENTLNAALRSYLGRCKDGTNVYNAWNYILKMRPRPVLPLDQLISGGRDVKSMLAQQINDWYINAEVDTSAFECLVSSEKLSSNLTGFSEFLQNVILTQAESFLSKYEERFVTLPKSFGTTPPPKAWKENEDWESAKVSLLFTSDDETRNGFGHSCLAYWRHYTFVPRDHQREKDEPAYKKLVANQDKLYLEPLSGAQSYLNTIIALGRTFREAPLSGHRLLTSLIETGLQRVLIIDERVSKFLQDHVDVRLTFDHIGVSAMCDTTEDVIKLFKAYKPDNDGSSIPAKSSVLDYEIVIIHMGIIDKLLPHHESKKAVEGFVKYLKRSLRYVVVTTGRGTPSNLPDDARVLPFSVVESTMFKKYPEKMILVANVMNVLPVNKEDGQ